MTYYYSLTRTLDEDEPYSTTTSVSDRDPINCAHMLAAVFNTMNGFIMPGWVLGVVDTKAGTVQYQGKVERFDRPEPAAADTWPGNMHFSKTFNFEGSTSGESLITFFGDNDETTYTVRGDVKADDTAQTRRPARSVLIAAYEELQAVKDVLADAGVETIPADAGVRELGRRLEHEFHARTAMEEQYGQANESARAELIKHVKRAYAKWGEVDPGRQREGLKSHLRGMIEVLSTYLVVTGEADADERHAVARRLCGIPEGTWV